MVSTRLTTASRPNPALAPSPVSKVQSGPIERFRWALTNKRKELASLLLHYQDNAHPGACRKTRVMPHNRFLLLPASMSSEHWDVLEKNAHGRERMACYVWGFHEINGTQILVVRDKAARSGGFSHPRLAAMSDAPTEIVEAADEEF
jgi:hypothetical protein